MDGYTVVFVAVDGALAGALCVADPINTSAARAVTALGDAGLRIVMLTGDTQTPAMAVEKTGHPHHPWNIIADDVAAHVLSSAPAACALHVLA